MSPNPFFLFFLVDELVRWKRVEDGTAITPPFFFLGPLSQPKAGLTRQAARQHPGDAPPPSVGSNCAGSSRGPAWDTSPVFFPPYFPFSHHGVGASDCSRMSMSETVSMVGLDDSLF